MALASIAKLVGPLLGLIDRVIPNPNEAMEIKAELMKESMNAESEFYKAAGGIIKAEAQGESWMQRNWRPVTMLTFVFIIANNYIIAPYVMFLSSMFGYHVELPTLDIPEGMWTLLSIGIGGYITSRGVEKTVKNIQQGGTPILGHKQSGISRQDLDHDRQKLIEELKTVR